MFEIRYTIEALVESNEQVGHAYKITEHQVLEGDDAFSSFLTTSYQQEVHPLIHPGDSLTFGVHLRTAPWLLVEKNMRMREDGQFEGEDLQQPTAELRPLFAPMLEKFMPQVQPGDVLSMTFTIQRY